MKSITEALKDVKKHLNIKNIKNVEVDYEPMLFDDEIQGKTKSIEIRFHNNKHVFVTTITRMRRRRIM
jgi:hypothetical protein